MYLISKARSLTTSNEVRDGCFGMRQSSITCLVELEGTQQFLVGFQDAIEWVYNVNVYTVSHRLLLN